MKNKEVLLFHDVDAEVRSFFRTYTLVMGQHFLQSLVDIDERESRACLCGMSDHLLPQNCIEYLADLFVVSYACQVYRFVQTKDIRYRHLSISLSVWSNFGNDFQSSLFRFLIHYTACI